jgi:hypothetical protein
MLNAGFFDVGLLKVFVGSAFYHPPGESKLPRFCLKNQSSLPFLPIAVALRAMLNAGFLMLDCLKLL